VEGVGHMTKELEVIDVHKSYGAGRWRKPVVGGCCLSLEEGTLTVMIGPSGAGKSTLVRLVAGFERPDTGVIRMRGAPVSGPSKDRFVMFQETALFPWLSTRDNVLFGSREGGDGEGTARARARQLLGRFALSAFADKYPRQLSGGMQRRAELARALLNEPRLMILDEPFRGLDALTKALMLEYYARCHEAAARTTLFVTTDIDEAIFLADHLLVMTHAPTRVAEIFDVDLPRPRALAMLRGDARVGRIKASALAILREQGLRAFEPRQASRPAAG